MSHLPMLLAPAFCQGMENRTSIIADPTLRITLQASKDIGIMPTQLLVSKQRVASPKIDQTPQRRNSLKTKVLNRILTSRSSSLNVNDDFVNGHIRYAFKYASRGCYY